MSIFRVKNFLKKFSFIQRFLIRKYIKSGVLVRDEDLNILLDDANNVILPNKLIDNINVGIVDDFGKVLENYEYARSYNPKFERFLLNNNIKFGNYDILASDWIEKAQNFDVILWHTKSDPNTQEIAKSKIYFLDKIMKKKCIPSFDALWSYEDKVNAHYLYKYYKLPEITTFVTHSKSEALNFIQKINFPIISKIKTGSASKGVFKIKDKKEAEVLIKKIFSDLGNRTYFGFDNQKGYVYFQKFIDDANYDLRIIVVGDKLLGYFRYPNKGDFKASGAGNYEKKEIPIEALDLAFEVKEKFNVPFLATDLLFSQKDSKYYIIESSIFIGIDTPEQLKIKGKSGYYQRIDKGEYSFVEGKYWVQEFMLYEEFKMFN